MTSAQTAEPGLERPLRLWPGVIAAVLLGPAWFVVPSIVPEAMFLAFIGALVGALAIAVWWLFFSRAPWVERIGAIVVMAVALLATSRLVHVSIRTGAMGMLLFVNAIPLLATALVGWAALGRGLAAGPRRAALVTIVVLVCGAFTLLRTDGLTGSGGSEFAWRWTTTAEQRLLAAAGAAPALPPAPAAAAPQAAWPGFRGPERDGVVRGTRIATDWSASPPVELWRRPIGPGWSSFAVGGDRLYTQEQRGDDEVVACYRVSTGEPVWQHRDAVRFWESNGGPGPRATPALADGRVYSLGATGVLNALDAGDGAVAWSRNVAADGGTKVPMWGFSGSPLVADELLIVAAAGRLLAYERASGEPRWTGPARGGGYSSPQRAAFAGVTQIVLLSAAGVTSVAPADGALLWEHAWEGMPIVQPALTAGGDLLVSTTGATGGAGTRRLAVARGAGGWTVAERWRSIRLKPYFNDFVVHGGHAFGFDGSILACIDLEVGARRWKGGRYGNGQLVLLQDQDLLLVLSEAGELALVAASPDEYRELARFAAISGKTWNHPVLAGDVLLARNGEEMAAFRLALVGR